MKKDTINQNDRRSLSALFCSSFRLLYENRGRIWSDPLLYGADVGVSTYGTNGKVGLGAFLEAVEANPSLFQAGSRRVAGFYGSPLSGTTVNRWVDLLTGEVSTTRGSGFIARVRALNAATALYPDGPAAGARVRPRDRQVPFSVSVWRLEGRVIMVNFT